MFRFLTLLFCLLLLNPQRLSANPDYLSGLIFQSHEVNKDERTSLDLLPEKKVSLKDEFTLEFDVKLMVAPHNYGYIFRIISSDRESLDLTSEINNNRLTLLLNNHQQIIESAEINYNPEEVRNKWVRISVVVTKEAILFRLNGNETRLSTSFGHLIIEKIFFGSNRHERYYTSDTPPMVIRNIIIKNKKDEIIRNWSLGRHAPDAVYDLTGYHRANVKNGRWEMDRHAQWTQSAELSLSSKNVQIATDSIGGRIFIATHDSLFVVFPVTGETEGIQIAGGNPYLGTLSYLIYDYTSGDLISYSEQENELMRYNFEENRWTGSPQRNSQHIQHHNRFIDKEINQLVVFGGYGMYSYHSKLLKHPLDSGSWEIYDFKEEIMPRYLASMIYLGNGEALLFGGYGSVSGLQKASPHNTFDLVSINTRNNSSKKLGELSGFNDHYTFGNSMVLSPDGNKLYTLGYKNDLYRSSIRLFEIDMSNFRCRFMGDSIPYNFQDTESFCDLFLYQYSRLYGVVFHKESDIYKLKVYSLLYPPLSESDILQTAGSSRKTYLAGFLILAGLLIGGFVFYKNRKGEMPEPASGSDELTNTSENSPPFRKSSILLLGGFQVFDKQGNDITGQFSPVLRQLFLYCLLESAVSDKGVTSERLEEVLWYDMDKAKAVNNRNVNIRKLRLLLQEIGTISLQKKNSYWRIELDKEVYCDYIRMRELLNQAEEKTDFPKSRVETLLTVAANGVLLPGQHVDWIDKYKSAYSVQLIKVLLMLAGKEEFAGDLYLLIRLADVVLLHDSIDEDSIRIKCRSLYLSGQKGLSKKCYDKFYADYRSLLNEVPAITYEDVINNPQKLL